MRAVAMLGMIIVLLSGFVASYLIYNQLDSETVVLEGEPQLQANASGSLCGQAAFEIDARTMGKWWLSVKKGQVVSGVVSVAGDEEADIGVKVYSPNNDLVLFEPTRQHELTFELPPAIRGDYLFEFDNRHSAFTEKQVAVQVCFA